MAPENERDREPALIQLGTPAPDFEGAVRLVEQTGGRVLHAFPPHALIAELPHGVGAGLAGRAGITTVSTGEVAASATRTPREPDPLGAVVEAWNAHLAAQRAPDRSLRGLSWDTPGLQPPDPPPEVKEQLRRRERQMRDDPHSDPEGEDREG